MKEAEQLRQLEIKKNEAIEDFVENMSLEEKISQLFIVNLVGNEKFLPVEKYSSNNDDLSGKDLIPGGYIFFSYNLADKPSKVMDFILSIKSTSISENLIPPFISIDQEGGFVNRLKELNGPLPSCKRVSENLTGKEVYDLYSMQAKEMKLLGFDMNIAPVVEIETDENSVFLNGRSFGNVSKVLECGKECINAYEENGISVVLKHFPGNTNVDPHSGLPEIKLSMEELEKQLIPFKEMSKINPTGILMSHARTMALDDENPACLSEKWIQEILRKQYGFEGIVFSDDIFMGALKKNGYPPEKACIQAIEAGITCIMISEKRFKAPAEIIIEKCKKDSGFLEKVNGAALRMIKAKIKMNILTLSENEGTYKVEINKNLEKTEEKIKSFTEVVDANRKFYMEKFQK